MPETLSLVSQQKLEVINREYVKQVSDRTPRRRLWLALLEKSGSIKFNHKGSELQKTVQFDEPVPQPYSGLGGNTFQQSDVFRRLYFSPRGYKSTDMVPDVDVRLAGGENDIVNTMEQKLPILTKAMRNLLGAEIFIDNTLASNTLRLGGLNTALKFQTAAAGDRIALPSTSATYGGQPIKLASEGGYWSSNLPSGERFSASLTTDWPDGNGQARYDWNSPKGINFNSTSWKNGNTFVANAEEVLSSALMWTQALSGDNADNIVGCYVMSGQTRFREFKERLRAKERIVVPHPMAMELGFANQINFEGAIVGTDGDCPSHEMYGFMPGQTELLVPDSSLFTARGPSYSFEYDAYLFYLSMLGMLIFSPKDIFKIADLTV